MGRNVSQEKKMTSGYTLLPDFYKHWTLPSTKNEVQRKKLNLHPKEAGRTGPTSFAWHLRHLFYKQISFRCTFKLLYFISQNTNTLFSVQKELIVSQSRSLALLLVKDSVFRASTSLALLPLRSETQSRCCIPASLLFSPGLKAAATRKKQKQRVWIDPKGKMFCDLWNNTAEMHPYACNRHSIFNEVCIERIGPKVRLENVLLERLLKTRMHTLLSKIYSEPFPWTLLIF